MAEHKLQWHPAFQAALQIELEEDKPYLRFFSEYNLTKKPQQIDILIRKTEGYRCKKKLARFFRGHNIIEYKSPDDYFSVNDFYKLMSYAGNYQSDTEEILAIEPEEITLSVICDKYPRGLVKHLQQRFSVVVEKKYPGIYYIEQGLIFPLQIIISKELAPEEYIWLSRLRSDLEIEKDIDVLSRAYRGKEKNPLYESVMDIIMRANKVRYEEAKGMCNALRELFADELAQAREQGISQGINDIVVNMFRKGFSLEQIADAVDKNLEEIHVIIESGQPILT